MLFPVTSGRKSPACLGSVWLKMSLSSESFDRLVDVGTRGILVSPASMASMRE